MKNQIPIYIISLSRTPERRLFMQRQLDALGLEYRFVDVDNIDKYEMESEEYRTRIAQSLDINESVLENKYAAIISYLKARYRGLEYDKNKNEMIGQLAIILAHIKIYNLMVKDDIAAACILEDDATLLPTFPQVLKAAPKFLWDILLLASEPSDLAGSILGHKPFRIRIFSQDILLFKQFAKNCNHRKNKDNRIERLLGEYGFDPVHHPKQSEFITRVVQEYDAKYTELSKAIIPNNRWLCVVKHEQYIMYKALRRRLKAHFSIQLGALPEKSSMHAITDYHYLAKPRHLPLSAAAYLVKQAAAVSWKVKALEPNSLVIDKIPWELYKNEQVKLRLVTLPCAKVAYHYQVYSIRRL